MLAKSDRKHFQALYNKYFEQIYLFILRRCANEDVAGDITQQAFIKAMVNLEKFEFRGLPFSSWLYKIALNELNLHFREVKKNRSVCFDESEINELSIEFPNENNEPELPMDVLVKALNSLTEGELAMVEMKYFEKRGHREIGEILGISESNAKVKLHRIINKMRKCA